MSHAFESGFVVREQAWHGLATVLENNPTIEEALAKAGLDWQVEAIPVFAKMPIQAELAQAEIDAGTGEPWKLDEDGGIIVPTQEIEIPTHRAVVRSSDKALLGIVSKDYKVFQNAEALAVFADLVKDGTLKIETAGSLQGGRKVWIQCRYADDLEVTPGDRIAPYILIAMGHDGKLSIVFMNTPTRVVCWNTMQAAGAVEDSVAGADFDKPTTFRIAHMGNVQEKVEQARDSIVSMNRDLQRSVDAYRKMASKPMSEQQVREIAQSIFDTDLGKAKAFLEKLRNGQAVRSEHMDVEQRQAVADKIREVEELLVSWKPSRAETKVVEAFHEGPGSDMAGETAWGMVNAVTNYIDHGKQGNQDRRMSASWFGSGARQRSEAFVIAEELARN